MADAYRACRQFERAFRYGILDREYIPPQRAISLKDSQLVAVIKYNHEKREVTVERKV